MPYYNNPTYTLENGILTIPNDCLNNIAGSELFAFRTSDNAVRIDVPTEIRKIDRGTLEILLQILGVTKTEIRNMKKNDLINYLTPRIVFQRN